MAKSKKLPGTKNTPKFYGPVTALEVTESHVHIKNDNSKIKKIPLHISIPYNLSHPKKRTLNESLEETFEFSGKRIKSQDKSCYDDKNWTYGISSEKILSELIKFKKSFSDYLSRGAYFSDLHKKLDQDSKRKGYYIPDSILYTVLKDFTSLKMKNRIISFLIEATQEFFHGIGSSRACDYVYKVLYGVAMEYLYYNIFEKPIEQCVFEYQHLSDDDPDIMPLTSEWQKEKCNSMNIPYMCQIEQHHTLAGQKLKHFTPARCEEIVRDGYCLFRCLSKMISGSEEFHSKFRAEICRYIVSDGIDSMGWHLKQFATTPLKYLDSSMMIDDTIWGSDVELMATSALLKTDIYVANRIYKSKESLIPEIRWTRIRSSNNNTLSAMYISNFFEYYEPVTRMMNSSTLLYETIPQIIID